MGGRRPIDSLLHTKLMPPGLHSTVILRQELLARLDDGLSKKLILLTAPTGYGKTTLISMWLAERGIPSSWVTLDENDNDPVRFWTYAISALRGHHPDLGKAASAALMASQPLSSQAILTPLINDMAKTSEPGVLVLEDYHTITNPEIHKGVAFLLQHLPANFHLVIVTRSMPDLPLGILRARDELLEFDAPDLRFSPAETEIFLRQSLKEDLSSSVLSALQERTEGWPAGLRLASIFLQNQPGERNAEKLTESFSGSHRYVADYLIREVFESQSQARQDFLLKTCFLDRLTGSLCEAITGTNGGESLLEQLERENLFLVRLEHRSGRIWYRYNSLFAESLQYLARQRLSEEEICSIYEKSSAWYESQQLYAEAIETALEAGMFERSLELIETYIEIHSMNELLTLKRWLEPIPIELITRHPEICLAYSQVILYSSDRYAPATVQHIEPYLHAAEDIWRAQGNTARLGAAASLRGMIYFWQGDLQKSFEYVHRSLAQLPEQEVYWRGISLLNAGFEAISNGQMLLAQDRILEARALMGASQNIHGVLATMQFLSEIFYWQGDLEQCVLLDQEIMDEAIGGEEMLDDQGIARANLADVAYERNDLEAAAQYAGQALEMGRQRGNQSLQSLAITRLAFIDAAWGNFFQAQEKLKTFVSGLPSGSLLREVQCAQAVLAIRAGEADSLDWWQAGLAAEKTSALALQREREAFTLARLRIAQGKPREAGELLTSWQMDAAENGRIRSQVEAWCIEALAQRASGSLTQAIQVLTQALAMGQSKGFCRSFLDEGAPMAALLQEIIPALTQLPLRLYASTMLYSFSTSASPSSSPGSGVLVEPLSQQEARVLRLLVAGRSNAEIGQELVVSTNTVKTHVKSIYRKLNVASREEARQVARELKLLG